MTLSMNQFSSIHARLQRDGGFSASPKTGAAPKSGFMVSEAGSEQQVSTGASTPQHLADYASRNSSALSAPDRYLGGWAGPRGTSLDVSRNVKPDRSTARRYGSDVAHADARTSAMDMGIAHDQEAVWDVKRGQEISIKGFTGR
jgi:hypothetical protein